MFPGFTAPALLAGAALAARVSLIYTAEGPNRENTETPILTRLLRQRWTRSGVSGRLVLRRLSGQDTRRRRLAWSAS